MLVNKAYPDKFRKYVGERVGERGVKVVYGDYVDEFPAPGVGGVVHTRKGLVIKADLAVSTPFRYCRTQIQITLHR